MSTDIEGPDLRDSVLAEWQSTGYLSYTPSEGLRLRMEACITEAWECYPRSQRGRVHGKDGGLAFSRDCVIDSPRKYKSIRGYDALDELATDPELVSLVNRLSARKVIPVRRGYKFYEDGDFLALHTDVPECDVTVTFATSDRIESIDYYPDAFRSTREELIRRFPADDLFPAGGEPMQVTNSHLNVFAGHDLPHARKPHIGPVAGIATVCYFAM